jgi:hypothetical protein
MKQGIGASQQRTKHTPPNTCYNLPNQRADFKLLLMKHAIFNSSKIVWFDSNLAIPVIETSLDMSKPLKNTKVYKNCLGSKGLNASFKFYMSLLVFFFFGNK